MLLFIYLDLQAYAIRM